MTVAGAANETVEHMPWQGTTDRWVVKVKERRAVTRKDLSVMSDPRLWYPSLKRTNEPVDRRSTNTWEVGPPKA